MKVGVIGLGKMGEAIVASLLHSKILEPHEISASEVNTERRELVRRRHGINVYSKNAVVPGMAETVFLAVKPQDLDGVLEEIAPSVTKEHLVISIAAGKTIASVQRGLPQARVVRVMPNIACLTSEGMSVFCAGPSATDADRRKTTKLLTSLGRVLDLPEERFDAVTALSGSGPAFFAYFLNCIVDAGVAEGLDRADARMLAEQTMMGTSRMLMAGGMNPAELMQAVSSPNGTTVAGLEVLRRSTVPDTVARTVRAAAQRSTELGA